MAITATTPRERLQSKIQSAASIASINPIVITFVRSSTSLPFPLFPYYPPAEQTCILPSTLYRILRLLICHTHYNSVVVLFLRHFSPTQHHVTVMQNSYKPYRDIPTRKNLIPPCYLHLYCDLTHVWIPSLMPIYCTIHCILPHPSLLPYPSSQHHKQDTNLSTYT